MHIFTGRALIRVSLAAAVIHRILAYGVTCAIWRCQLKWEDDWNAKPFPACSIVQLSHVARLLCGSFQVICQASRAPYYFLPFDCPLCHGATLLSCHVISLILLTSSEQYLVICNGGNVSCQKMVPGNRVPERQRKLKWENKRLSERKRR